MTNQYAVASTAANAVFELRASEQQAVLRIAPDGRIFWKQREIETDDEFRAAMLEVRGALMATNTAPPEPVNAWIAASKALPEIDTPVLAMRIHAEPAMYPMMRVDGGDGWLWAAYQGGPIEDPSSYEADDDYLIVEWTPLPPRQQE